MVEPIINMELVELRRAIYFQALEIVMGTGEEKLEICNKFAARAVEDILGPPFFKYKAPEPSGVEILARVNSLTVKPSAAAPVAEEIGKAVAMQEETGFGAGCAPPPHDAAPATGPIEEFPSPGVEPPRITLRGTYKPKPPTPTYTRPPIAVPVTDRARALAAAAEQMDGMKRRSPKGWEQDQYDTMMKMRAAGHTWKEVGEAVGHPTESCEMKASELRKAGRWNLPVSDQVLGAHASQKSSGAIEG